MKKKKRTDMSRAEIRYRLMEKGLTLAELGRRHGLADTTLRNALDKRYPKGERIIAEAINLKPEEIWWSRYGG